MQSKSSNGLVWMINSSFINVTFSEPLIHIFLLLLCKDFYYLLLYIFSYLCSVFFLYFCKFPKYGINTDILSYSILFNVEMGIFLFDIETERNIYCSCFFLQPFFAHLLSRFQGGDTTHCVGHITQCCRPNMRRPNEKWASSKAERLIVLSWLRWLCQICFENAQITWRAGALTWQK